VGTDIHQEYYFSNLAKNQFHWDSTIPNEYNAMLSIVMLAPILSFVTGLSITWVFKIIYPLLFSFVPLVLFQIFRKQTNNKIAFFSVFYFMSVITFFTEMLGLARQEIAEIFLSLLILLFISKKIDRTKQASLLIIFYFSLVVSHYGASYIFLFVLVCSLLILFVTKKTRLISENKTISKYFVFLYAILLICWYVYVSGSATFNIMIIIASLIARNITDLFNPQATQGLNILLSTPESFIHGAFKIFQVLMLLFITIGIIDMVFKLIKKKSKFDFNFASFSLVSFFFCLSAVAVPFVSGALNTTRLFHITLFFLAPFCVLGTVFIFRTLFKASILISKKAIRGTTEKSLKAFSIILAIFLLFNTGFVYEILQDLPYSISLSQNWTKEHGNGDDKFALYSAIDLPQEVVSASWLAQHRNPALGVYADYRSCNNVLNAYAMISRSESHAMGAWGTKLIVIENWSYIYLRKVNIFDGVMGGSPQLQATGLPDTFNSTSIISLLPQEANIIYSNGGSEIFYTVRLMRSEIDGK